MQHVAVDAGADGRRAARPQLVAVVVGAYNPVDERGALGAVDSSEHGSRDGRVCAGEALAGRSRQSSAVAAADAGVNLASGLIDGVRGTQQLGVGPFFDDFPIR